MGQILSLPMIAAGIVFIVRSAIKMSKLKARLAAHIKQTARSRWPIIWMPPCLIRKRDIICAAHRLAPHDGAAIHTAPEISQMFGELIGAWCLIYGAFGRTQPVNLVELGPGRGTLMADICRTAGQNPDFIKHLPVYICETSPTLRAEQKQRVPHAIWHDSIATLPEDAMSLVIANEIFDALPITQ